MNIKIKVTVDDGEIRGLVGVCCSTPEMARAIERGMRILTPFGDRLTEYGIAVLAELSEIEAGSYFDRYEVRSGGEAQEFDTLVECMASAYSKESKGIHAGVFIRKINKHGETEWEFVTSV